MIVAIHAANKVRGDIVTISYDANGDRLSEPQPCIVLRTATLDEYKQCLEDMAGVTDTHTEYDAAQHGVTFYEVSTD